ncbi:unnamed protein product [Callosobruchus maculatus]|uniref:Protein OSCP1 n=1 Tax=Callosobruchus maculatus TaxID=64391 RepID=A0A653BNL7_CALMS|nr:unnamed protein product [Callosobruchus maculatus]
MSHYVTPFLVLNLGSEMVFVIAQRLDAQNIPQERATLVLEEIISVLVSKKLIGDLMRPQAAYNHESVRDMIEDITQSSVMRLDPVSMGKLWDLISMVFKWQMSMTDDIIGVTLRHLYEVETYVTNQETHQQLQKVQNLVENFNKILDSNEKLTLHEDVMYWLKDFNIRVSLLLRMGLQTMDGNFVVNNLSAVAEEMLKNLGENIYQVTQNGKILENSNSSDTTSKEHPRVNEMELFANEILGERKLSSGSTEANGNTFKLSINDENANAPESKKCFDSIDVNIGKLEDLMGDISLKSDDEEEKSFKDDLLEMIGGDSEK